MGILNMFEGKFGDIDHVFAFQTGKVVVLKDRVLGLLAIGLKISIVIYLIITVILNKGYLIIEQPRGTSRMTLEMASWDDVRAETNLSYCTNPISGGPNANVDRSVIDCSYLDTDSVVLPSLGNQFFVSTRMKFSTLNYNGCAGGQYGANLSCIEANLFPSESEKKATFVAGIEAATLFIGHTIEGRGEVEVEKQLTEMSGEVLDCNGNTVKKMPKKDPKMSNFDDLRANRIFKIGDLLKWARPGMHKSCGDGVILDKKSNLDPSQPNATLRYDGIVLHVVLDYDNTGGSSQDEVDYTMKLTAVLTSDPKYVTLDAMADRPGEKMKINRHGVHIIVVQTGKLGKFSFSALVISGTAGLGLLAIATTITDLLAKFVMPLKEEYRKMIFEYSEDYSDVKDKKEAELQMGLVNNEQEGKI
eukprot:TRINITY_DN36910_c0_g1_i1.p1 TRINITY_DN36910_c0_g1~~TRINITY_DN36910_c0_g1_i1.p1  ORF type:complete len:450 (+),score=67.94 TRINITY_DN36910_c0_g1_i1:100-1350(+)